MQSSITPTMSKATTVSAGLSTSMEISTLTTVMQVLTNWGKLWLIICRRVSVSLV